MRIASLLPSATEILFAIGAGDDVVGVSFECSYPLEARTRTILSSSALPEGLDPAGIDAEVRSRATAGEDLYHLHRDALADVDADLVISQDLCGVCAVDVTDITAALRFLGSSAAVLNTDPHTVADVLDSILVIGATVGRTAGAEQLVAALETRLAAVAEAVSDRDPVSALILEWTDPPYAPGHWVPELIELAGGSNVLGERGARSVAVDWPTVLAADPAIVICAPCGYGLDDSAAQAEAVLDRLPVGIPVWAMDSDGYVVRPGPRLVDGIEALAAILHPDRRGPVDSTVARRIR